MSFSDEMRAFAKKTGGKLEDVARDVVLSVGRKVVEMSPVGLRERWQVNIIRAAKGLPLTPKGYVGGHFRVNWQHGFGAPAIGEIDGTDNAGSATIARIRASIDSSPASGVHFISNNTKYAQALENGHSTVAPEGMVGVTVILFQDIVTISVQKAKA